MLFQQFVVLVLFWVSFSPSISFVNYEMPVCSRIDCNQVGLAESPQHRLPQSIIERRSWIRKLREGDTDLQKYLDTHTSKSTTFLKCCRSHFRLEDLKPPGPHKTYVTLAPNALPMSPSEEKAYRIQLQEDRNLEQIREQVSQTPGTLNKQLRGGRVVVHQPSTDELQCIITDLQRAKLTASSELDALRTSLAAKTEEVRLISEQLQQKDIELTATHAATRVRMQRADADLEAERHTTLRNE